MRKHRPFLFALTMALAACGGAQHAAPRATPTMHNPINVPLYPGAAVVATRPVRTSGAASYTGMEVLAASGATFAQLSQWVTRLQKHPPSGYAAAPEAARTRLDATQYGFDYAILQTKHANTTHDVLVVVMDPQRVNAQFGMVLDVVGRYRMLPGFMRKPIDDRIKQRLGITLSEAMQPTNPIGATLNALDEFGHRNSRGIVMIDAARR